MPARSSGPSVHSSFLGDVSNGCVVEGDGEWFARDGDVGAPLDLRLLEAGLDPLGALYDLAKGESGA